MKKIYSVALMLAFFSQVNAQVLNQSAGWPNAAWTVTGDYNTDPLAFESDPTVTANFAFDDDDAGNGHEDNITVESPVIDLTAAFAANEKSLEIAVSYGYYYSANDQLQFQYWDVATSAWIAWPGNNIPNTGTSVFDNFCLLPKVAYVSEALNISNFTPAQLAGFRYRISYDDDPDGDDWNYGFCFESPTIISLGCAPTSGILVEDVTTETADISWSEGAGTGYEIIIDELATDPTVAGTPTTDLSYSAGGLTPSTTYYVHIRTNCGDSFSLWRTVMFRTTAVPPLNDACADAIVIEGFPYNSNAQDASAATNNDGYIEVCENTMNDGVWYTFTGDGSEVQVTLTEVGEWDPQLDIYAGTCGSFSCVASADSGGTTGGEEIIFLSEVGTTYYVNVGHYSGSGDSSEGQFSISIEGFVPPEAPANDACENAIVIADFPYTNSQDASAATNNDGTIEVCENTMNDGVWYTFAGNGSELQVSLSGIIGWDPQLDVYAGTCGSFTCVGTSETGGTGGAEQLVFLSEVGTTYYVNVGHYSATDNDEGPFTITVQDFVPPVLPENDACAGATAMTSFPYTNTQDAILATNNDGFIEACEDEGMNDGVWYTFTGNGSDVVVTLSGVGSWDPQLGIFTGSCDSFTCVGTIDSFGSGGGETLTVEASETGVTYYVNVGRYGTFDAAEGPFTISATSSDLGVSSNMNANFKYHPNPVKDVLNVSYTKNISNVTVFNMLGQQVLAKSLNVTNGQVDLSSLNSGTYIVNVTSGVETKTIKVVKL